MPPRAPVWVTLFPILGMASSCLAAALLLGACPSRKSPLLYVSNEISGDITVVDTGADAVVATIRVGKRPRGLRLSPDGRTLYVAVSGSPRMPPGSDESKAPPADRSADGLAVIDIGRRELARILPSGQDPESFDITPDGRLIYVSNEETARASVVETATGRILHAIEVGEEPEGVTITPDGRSVWVTSEADGVVAVLEVGSEAVAARLPVGARPRSVAFTPDGAIAVVSAENDGAVTLADAGARQVLATVKLPRGKGTTPPRPMGVVISPDGKLAYVSNGRASSVSVIDLAARALVRTYDDIGARPWGIALSPDGKKLYTANGPSNDVSVVDAASGRVLKRIPTGEGPWGLALGR